VAGLAAAWLLLHRRLPSPPAESNQKRLTFNSSEKPIGVAEISPDAKYLAYSDLAGFHIKLLSTGEERVIPKPAGAPPGAGWFPDGWFPDGTQLLADTMGPGAQHSMGTVSVVGQSAHDLREGASGWGVSPDGTRIAFSPVEASGDCRELWVMGSQGDNPQRVLGLGQNESLWDVHWAPDGQRLAYIKARLSPGKYDTTLGTCDLKGENRTVVVRGTDRLRLRCFCWLPDGRIIYDSLGSYLWQVSVSGRTGEPIGEPKRIAEWAGSSLGQLTASADGKRLTFLKFTRQEQLYLGELTAGGTRMNPPRRLTNDDASDEPWAWTADSSAVLFSSNRNGFWSIFKQGITQETPEPVISGSRSQDADFPRLSADGTWILYTEFPNTGRGHGRLMRVPANGGASQFLLDVGYLGYSCARAPASLCLITEESQDKKKFTLTALDPLKGRGKVLRTIEKNPSVHFGPSGQAERLAVGSLSPDGSTYALYQGDEAQIHIRLLSLTGGSDHEIVVKGWPNVDGLEWAPDGKALYVGSESARTLLHVDLQGNARVLWQFKGGGGQIWGVPSPDSRYLAILVGTTNSNVWMLEGF
jgi:Tol biopolymer transport system component